MTEIRHLPLEVTEPPELRTQSTSLTPGTFLRPSFKFLFNDELFFGFFILKRENYCSNAPAYSKIQIMVQQNTILLKCNR